MTTMTREMWKKAIQSKTWTEFLEIADPEKILLGEGGNFDVAWQNYKASNPTFNWLNEDVQSFIKSPTLSMQFGVPQMITGNPEKSHFFHVPPQSFD